MDKDMLLFITENYLRQNFGLAYGSEIQLPLDAQFTPDALALIKERALVVRRIDQQGRIFVDDLNRGLINEQIKQVHPLNTKPLNTKQGLPENTCSLCYGEVSNKPAIMTHLNNKMLVPKNHPRIALRGALDTCISYCVLLQTEFENEPLFIQGFLSDIRSYLGKVLQSEVTEELLSLPYLGEFGPEQYHQWSHYPLKHLGYDHMLPDKRYGSSVAKLNYLRAQVRALEISASHVYIDQNMSLTREDIIAGLNRLSSAVYVTMIFLWQYQTGNREQIDNLLKGTLD